jgi:hypothetical protein
MRGLLRLVSTMAGALVLLSTATMAHAVPPKTETFADAGRTSGPVVTASTSL